MYDWLLWSTTDMVNWTEHGAVASLKDIPWRSRENGAWAIQTVERNGKYYLYAPLHGHGIAVLEADSPYGPFKDPLGKPLVWDQSNWYDIDPSVYTGTTSTLRYIPTTTDRLTSIGAIPTPSTPS